MYNGQGTPLEFFSAYFEKYEPLSDGEYLVLDSLVEKHFTPSSGSWNTGTTRVLFDFANYVSAPPRYKQFRENNLDLF